MPSEAYTHLGPEGNGPDLLQHVSVADQAQLILHRRSQLLNHQAQL